MIGKIYESSQLQTGVVIRELSFSEAVGLGTHASHFSSQIITV